MKEIIGKYKEENENFSFKLEKFKAETESIEKKNSQQWKVSLKLLMLSVTHSRVALHNIEKL